jgi:hypothetical protein
VFCRLLVAAQAILLISGCAGLSGSPPTTFPSQAALSNNVIALTDNDIDAFHRATDKEEARNRFIEKRIAAIDTNFENFVRQVYGEDVISRVGVEWVAIGTATAGALIRDSTTQAVLAAITAALIGGKAAYDKNALFDRTVPALMAQMRASRLTVRAQILRNMQQEVQDYGLLQAQTDVAAYYNAGTIPGAIASVLESSGEQSRNALEEIRNLTRVTYGPDEVTEVLQRFWTPDGTNPDPQNQRRMEGWLEDKRIDAFLAFFLQGSEYAFARKEMAQDLGLIPRE